MRFWIRRSSPLLAVAMLGLAAGSANASTSSCDPLRPLVDLARLPPAYRDAVAELVEATARPGQPWSCSGGTIDVSLDPSGGAARVTIADGHGRTAHRDVEGPEDLRAVVEALLAKPVVPAPSAEEDRPAPAPPSADAPAANPVAPPPPRLRLAVTLGPRVSGPIASAWGSGEVRGAIPIDPYEIALWVRLSLPIASRDLEPRGLSWQDASAGLGLGRTLFRRGIELAARIDAGLSVVTMDSEYRVDHVESEGARVGFRLGLGLGASMPIGGAFRGVAVIDGALAPAALARNDKIAEGLPDVPIYSFGLSLGAEANIQ